MFIDDDRKRGEEESGGGGGGGGVAGRKTKGVELVRGGSEDTSFTRTQPCVWGSP